MESGILIVPIPYCELHTHSCFSLLDGVPFPEELAGRAAELGLGAIALTDHDSLYGLVPFYLRAQSLGVKPIVGAELTMEDGSHLTVLAENDDGYRSLCQLISAGRLSAPKGESRLSWSALSHHTHGLLCLTGCRRGTVLKHLAVGDVGNAKRLLSHLLDLFGRRKVYVELQRNLRRDDVKLSRRLVALAHERDLPYIATGNVHYLTRDDADVQSALVSVSQRVPLPKAQSILRPNHEYFLRSAAAMLALYSDIPRAVTCTLEVAERCNVKLPMGLQVLPPFPAPCGMNADDYLRSLCSEALPRHYPHNTNEARALLEKELALISQLRLANYFLVVWDIVAFCAKHGILCHGRGSAANSIVAKLLGISAVDPIAQQLVVERFISVEHGGTPDIDLDIDAAQREIVIQYVYNRYGRDHAAMACTYITYRSASAIRDAGFALGFKQETLDEIASALESERRAHELDDDGRVEKVDVAISEITRHSKLSSAEWQRLVSLAERLRGRPRHLGLHNGGMVVTGQPISDIVPIEPATMENRTVVQFDKEGLESLGIVKIDLLGLRMLSAIGDTVKLVKEIHGKQIDLHRLNFKGQSVYDQICSARTIGIFQVESGAQVSLIPHLQPRRFQDLVIEVSLIRPGPLQGGMVRPYIRRRNGQEAVTYLHPLLKPALEETLGVIVFQEQVIKVARDVAGFTPGCGELLRRALGNKNAAEAVKKFREEFIQGAKEKDVPEKIAEAIWNSIAGFAGYSFSKAHAAAFAVIVYWSAWLRVHYPTEYFCGLLRNAPLGTYPARVLESEAQRVGVKFLPFDINRSMVKPTIEKNAIRFGLIYVKGIGESLAETIVQTRGTKSFTSLNDFVQRVKVERRAMEWLILSGAFDSLGERRQLLWDLAEALQISKRPPSLPLDIPDEYVELSPMLPEQLTLSTFAATGVTGGMHLTEVRRDAFTKAGCTPLADLQKMRLGTKVKVGGLVADGVRRPPTAKGVAFLRLEHRDGLMDVILPSQVFVECREALSAAFVIVEGTLQSKGVTTAIVAKRVARLSD